MRRHSYSFCVLVFQQSSYTARTVSRTRTASASTWHGSTKFLYTATHREPETDVDSHLEGKNNENVKAHSCLSCRMGHWLGTPQLWSLATPTSKKNRRAPPSSFTWLSHPSYCHEPVPHSLCHHAGEPHFDPATTAIAEAGGHLLATLLLANLAEVMCIGSSRSLCS